MSTWHRCYDESWKGLIVEEAFAHPAKMARGLVRRIFDHLDLPKGSVVVDPFGGIGSTAIEGASRGYQVFCCELEAKFVELAQRNFTIHKRTWEACGDPIPCIVQGDSRRLREVLGPVMADCVVSSPPFSSPGCQPPNVSGFRPVRSRWSEQPNKSDSYGTTDGQLGAMLPGSLADCIVSSPPYEGSLATKDGDGSLAASGVNADGTRRGGSLNTGRYGHSDGQLGQESGETFWSAANDIVSECYQILNPGGLAVWVCKDFVRKGERVPFSRDWATLCESQGFTLVEWIHASLVKTESHPGLFGEDVQKTKERKSFFRRLAEAKGSPAIDHEDVLIMSR